MKATPPSRDELAYVLHVPGKTISPPAPEDRNLRRQPAGGDAAELGRLARSLQKARRRREDHFPDLFTDPAWDMLLDLFSANEDGARVSVSGACAAARVPPTTALRTLAVLERRGLAVRRPDPGDARASLISLSDDACERMVRWLAGMRSLMLASLADVQRP